MFNQLFKYLKFMKYEDYFYSKLILVYLLHWLVLDNKNILEVFFCALFKFKNFYKSIKIFKKSIFLI